MATSCAPPSALPAATSAPPPAVWRQVEQILTTARPLAVACTGGGSLAVNWLSNHPGASACLVDARIPYHQAALAVELGGEGPHRVVEETARRLARRAQARAAVYSGRRDAVGLGVTAALATKRPRRGEDRAFAAVRAPETYLYVHLRFDKGAAHRLLQEEALSTVLVDLVARACGISEGGLEVPLWGRLERAAAPVDCLVEALLEAEGVDAVQLGERGSVPPPPEIRLLVPGSFNPLHDGHLGLAAAAESRSSRPAVFELSVINVDKPALAYRDVMVRAGQNRLGRDLLLTRAPAFLDKARRFPGCWFAIGFDTAVRLLAPAYYGGSPQAMAAALAEMRDLGSRFLVAGRFWKGAFRRLADVDVPPPFVDLFEEITPSEFRLDVSSTALRQEG